MDAMRTLFEANRIVVALLLFASGCASVRDREPAATTSNRPISQSTEGRLAAAESVNANSKTSIAVPVHPASFTLDAHDQIEGSSFELVELGTAEESPALTLDQIEQIALANNPTIISANAGANKAVGLQNQVGTRPNPTVGYSGNQIADEGTDQHTIYFEQEFIRGKKLQLNRQVLSHTTNAQRLETEVQRHRVLTDVRIRFL